MIAVGLVLLILGALVAAFLLGYWQGMRGPAAVDMEAPGLTDVQPWLPRHARQAWLPDDETTESARAWIEAGGDDTGESDPVFDDGTPVFTDDDERETARRRAEQ